MAQQMVNIGAVANDNTGDTLRDGGDKINDNFTELYGLIGAGVTGLLDFKGSTDCSANPNYPAASKGDYYLVSVAGKIGGASGIVVQAGDSYFALADNAGGTQAGVGASWAVIQGNVAFTTVGSNIATIPNPGAITFIRINADNSVDALSASAFRAAIGAGTGSGSGDMLGANNLSDVANAATARGNIGAQARTPAVQSVASSATVTPTFSDDIVDITAQAAALNLANPTGTAIPNLGMVIRIKDNGTARAITYDTQYRAIGVTLPTTTVISKTLVLGMIYNANATKWDVVAVAQEA